MIGLPGAGRLESRVGRETVAFLDERCNRFTHIVHITEAMLVFDFSNVRSQAMIVEYIPNPS